MIGRSDPVINKTMKLSSHLDPKFIMLNFQGNTIEDVISKMIDKISYETCEINSDNRELIKQTVLKRETELSTAIGNGIAIPHGRLKDFKDFIIAIAVMETPFKMNLIGHKEEEKVDFVVLILSDILKNKNMLKAMSAISKLSMKNTVIFEKLKKSKTPSELIDLIQESNIEIEHQIVASDLFDSNLRPVTPTTTLEVVAQRLISEQISGLPVVDEQGNIIGEITERELISFGMPKYTHLLDDLNFLTVGEPFEEYLLNENITTIETLYRKKGIFTVDLEAGVMAICSIIIKKNATRIYVIENNKYIGIIKRADIIKKVLHL